MKNTYFQDVQAAWSSRYLPHCQQRLDDDCSNACLRMLAPINRCALAADFPTVIPTDEMPLRAAQLGIFLEQQPITHGAFTFGTYLILRNHHWFIIQFRSEEEVMIHDPARSEPIPRTAHEFNRMSMDNCAAIFRVIWTAMP